MTGKKATQHDRTVTVVRPVLTIDELRIRPSCTVEQAGAVLGIGRASAYAAAARGEIPTVKVGKRLIVPAQALLRMLDVPQPESA